MKKFICLFICFIILLSYPMAIHSEEALPWEAEYTRMIQQTAKNENTQFVLADVDYNNIPELIAGDTESVSLYTYNNGSLIKMHETRDIPIAYFAQMKAAQNTKTRITEFLSQIVIENRTTTYKLHFDNGTPSLETQTPTYRSRRSSDTSSCTTCAMLRRISTATSSRMP